MVIHPVVTLLDTVSFLLVTTDLYGESANQAFVRRDANLEPLHFEWTDLPLIAAGSLISLFGLLLAALFFAIALSYFLMCVGFLDISNFNDRSQVLNNPHVDAFLISLFSLCFVTAGFRVYKFGVNFGAALWILILYKFLAQPLKRGMLLLGVALFILARNLDIGAR